MKTQPGWGGVTRPACGSGEVSRRRPPSLYTWMLTRLHVEIMPFGRRHGQGRDEHWFARTNAV